MRIDTKFNNGDKVVWISHKLREEWEPCGFCGATGVIRGANGKEESCPICNSNINICYGKCGKTIYKFLEWQITKHLTIGQVQVSVTGKWEGSNQTFSNYSTKEFIWEERYMCRETGIGSGSLYNYKDLFLSEKEAQAECDRRNRNDYS